MIVVVESRVLLPAQRQPREDLRAKVCLISPERSRRRHLLSLPAPLTVSLRVLAFERLRRKRKRVTQNNLLSDVERSLNAQRVWDVSPRQQASIGLVVHSSPR
jgi:hypothetical protein